MRVTRIISFFTALALALALATFTASSATAEKGTAARASEAKSVAAPAAPAARAKKLRRTITLDFKPAGRKFNYSGKVSGSKAVVKLTYSKSKNGKYRSIRKTKTNNKYAFKGLSKLGWYRVTTPPTNKYARGYSRKSHIVLQ